MPKFLKFLPVVAALSLGGAAFAQDAAQQPAAESATPGLSMGEQAQVEPYIRESSGDWQMECLRTGTDDEPCQLLQEMNGQDGAPVATIRLFKLEAGGEAEAGAVIAVPLETLLTTQLTLAVDGGQAKRYPFSVCDRLGCYARIGLRAAEIDEFKRGSKATIAIVPFVAPNQQVVVDMSLKGFTAAYDKVMPTPGQ